MSIFKCFVTAKKKKLGKKKMQRDFTITAPSKRTQFKL